MIRPLLGDRAIHLVVAACACVVFSIGWTAAAWAESTAVRDVLDGSGVGAARFGQTSGEVTAHLASLLGQPRRPYARYLGFCRIDHEIAWRGLDAFFFRGRFVGYSYGPPPTLRAPILATTKGFAIGDTMAEGRRLYGRGFRLSTEQGGAWFASDPTGTVDGLASGGKPPKHSDVGPLSLAASIGAGHQGCPAMSP